MKSMLMTLFVVTSLGAAFIVPARPASAISMPSKLYCLAISLRPQTGAIEGCGYTKSECNRRGYAIVQEEKRKHPKATYGCSAQ